MASHWQPLATIAAPLIAFFVGFAFNRWLEKRPKLILYMPHSAAVKVDPPDGHLFVAHTHSVVVKNVGRATANSVRLTHVRLPESFSVYPSVEYNIVKLADGGAEIVFPKLVPKQELTVTYLYFPPLFANQIHAGCRSDETLAEIVEGHWLPQPSIWLKILVGTLMALGLLSVISLVIYSLATAVAP